MQHDIHKALIKTRTSNKSGFVWANRPLRAHCSTREILLLLTLLAANHKKNCHLQRDIRKEYTNIPVYCIHATVPPLPYFILHFEKPLLSGQLAHS